MTDHIVDVNKKVSNGARDGSDSLDGLVRCGGCSFYNRDTEVCSNKHVYNDVCTTDGRPDQIITEKWFGCIYGKPND